MNFQPDISNGMPTAPVTIAAGIEGKRLMGRTIIRRHFCNLFLALPREKRAKGCMLFRAQETQSAGTQQLRKFTSRNRDRIHLGISSTRFDTLNSHPTPDRIARPNCAKLASGLTLFRMGSVNSMSSFRPTMSKNSRTVSMMPFILALVSSGGSSFGAPFDAQSPITSRPPLEIASGGGQRGAWRHNESNYDCVGDPTVALDSQGNAVVAWADQRQKDIFLQVYNRDGKPRHKNHVNVSRSPKIFSWLPRVALSSAQPSDAYILWQEIVFSGGSHGGEIFFARSRDGGANFSEPLNLSNSINGDGKGRINKENWHNGSLDLAIVPAGTVYAAWTEYDGPLWFSRSADGGESFSKPMSVGGGGGE